MKALLLTVGNIYIDHNIFGVDAGGEFRLEGGKEYSAVRSERVLGSSAINAAMQAQKLGIEVGFVGKTGIDEGAGEVRTLLQSEGILDELVIEDADQTTSMAVNLIDKSGEFIGLHYGNASRTLSAADMDLEHDLFNRCQAIYFGGTAKQSTLFKECNELFRRLTEKGIKVFYDPNRLPVNEVVIDRSLLQNQLAKIEGYFPNEEELLQLTGESSIDEALKFAVSSGPKFVALKRGAQGCRVKTHDQDFTIEAHRVEALTTVGAGDCFNATFIAYYLKGLSLQECAERATTAASLKVSQNIWPDEVAIEAVLH